MRARFALFLASTLLALGCARAPGDPPRWTLEGGETLASRVVAEGATVVLVVDPGDFSRCFVPLSRWVEWERRHPGRLALLLSRPATETERRQLVRYRVRPDGVVAGAARRASPAELLFVDGRARYVRVGAFGALTDALLETGPGLDPARVSLPSPLPARGGPIPRPITLQPRRIPWT